MAPISAPNRKTVHWRDDPGRNAADPLACPLVFSVAGLLTDCLALAIQHEASAPLGFVLIAAAAPIAATMALRFAGNAGERLA